MIIDSSPVTATGPAWVSIPEIAAELDLPIEIVRISAVVDLDLDLYDPERDIVSERGRDELRDYLRRS